MTRARPRLAAMQAALVAADLAAIAVALAAGYVLRFYFEVGAREVVPVAPFAEYLKPLAMLLVVVPLLLRLFGLYRTDGLLSGVEELHAIGRAVTAGSVLVLALTFFYRREGFQFSRLTFAYFWAIATALLALDHAAFRRALVARYRAGLDRRRALVVGEPAGFLLEKLRSEPAFGVEVVGFVGPAQELPRKRERVEDPTGSRRNEVEAGGGEEEAGADSGRAGVLVKSAVGAGRAAVAAPPRLGATADLAAVLARGDLDEAIIADGSLSHRALLETLDACERAGVEVRLIPPIYDLLVEPADLTYVEGVPLVRIDEARFHRTRQLVKRAFDVAASATALVLLAPVLGAVALAIRAGSPGPALFVQTRAGRGGRPFRMLKFRTMVADAERRLGEVVDLERLAEPVFKLAADPRVTRVGRLLRRFSLDELPQLVNVLRGDMSVVGPRPEEMRIVERYDVWQRRRLKVKPGITGLQQVEARGTLSTLNDRVRLDVYYIRKQSLLLDLAILARTVAVVISGRGAT
jgi:lipopolysaccharide/colanic/teichoic acid biosynthesis glycosyltransferase